MNTLPYFCAICETAKTDDANWFLLFENPWNDHLKILAWAESLAKTDGFYSVCCPGHMQQLVAHWIAVGNLNYPFARAAARPIAILPSHGVQPFTPFILPDMRDLVLGELSVDRESLSRMLIADPESLVPILESLVSALGSPSSLTSSVPAIELDTWDDEEVGAATR